MSNEVAVSDILKYRDGEQDKFVLKEQSKQSLQGWVKAWRKKNHVLYMTNTKYLYTNVRFLKFWPAHFLFYSLCVNIDVCVCMCATQTRSNSKA